MNLVNRATALALKAHHGQINKHDGEPYILHVHRVAMAVSHLLPEVIATAWLHDTLEDTALTFSEIEAAVGEEVAHAVQLLTKQKGVELEVYYRAIARNELARAVKLCDIHDNFGRNHLIEDDETRLRMAAKYSLGISILTK